MVLQNSFFDDFVDLFCGFSRRPSQNFSDLDIHIQQQFQQPYFSQTTQYYPILPNITGTQYPQEPYYPLTALNTHLEVGLTVGSVEGRSTVSVSTRRSTSNHHQLLAAHPCLSVCLCLSSGGMSSLGHSWGLQFIRSSLVSPSPGPSIPVPTQRSGY
jgi:hypothetical protein